MINTFRRAVVTSLSAMAALALIIMMCHIVLNAILRFGFNSPVTGTNEVVEYWYLPFVALAGIPAAQLNKEHIIVNIITERFSLLTAKLFAIFILSLALIFSLSVTWFGFQVAQNQASINATGGVINIIVWPAYFIVPIMFGLLSIVLLMEMLQLRDAQDNIQHSVSLVPDAEGLEKDLSLDKNYSTRTSRGAEQQ